MRRSGALVIAILCASAPAFADDTQQQADKLFDEGRDLLVNKHDSKGACEKFEAAIKLDPTATGTMLNLGLCYENLGKLSTSLRWFRRAQAAASEGRQPEHEAAAKAHTIALAARVPTIHIDLAADAPGTEVRIDGIKVDPTDYQRYEVDPGHHEVDARAPHKVAQHATFDVVERDSKPVAIAAFADVTPTFVDRGAPRRKLAYIFGGIGSGLIVGTGVYALIERKINTDAYDAHDRKKAQASIDRLRTIGTSTFIAGCAGLATAAILYFTAPGVERIESATLWRPMISPDQIGLAVGGSF